MAATNRPDTTSGTAVREYYDESVAPILEIDRLTTKFHTSGGTFKAVDDVSLHVRSGETLGVVGESGCGKSVTALSILRLVPSPPGDIAGGEIRFQGENLLEKSVREMEDIRGNHISMIFQEPLTALNPVFSVEFQLVEGISRHRQIERQEARERALDMLNKVGIPDAKTRLRAYPHELSGGMRQRVMIAMALACEPKLLIADEPTTALDVTIQAQILDLLRRLRDETGTAIMMITHDLGVIAEMADRVAVMYAGEVVETAPVRDIFRNTSHPYSLGLLDSLPKMTGQRGRLRTISGMVPSLAKLPGGCRFAPRCRFATDRCRKEKPSLVQLPEDERRGVIHQARCFYAEQVRNERKDER